VERQLAGETDKFFQIPPQGQSDDRKSYMTWVQIESRRKGQENSCDTVYSGG
jgi:hypothetical protein